MAVRLALGATRARLRRQVLTESLLSVSAVGFLESPCRWATRSLSSFHLPAPVPLDVRVGVDWRVLLFTFAISVACGLLLGIGPGVGGVAPAAAERFEGRRCADAAGRRWSLRNVLVIAQIAMSLATAFGDGPVFAQPGECGQDRHRIPDARAADAIGRSPAERLHGGTHQRVSGGTCATRDGALPGVDAAVCTDVPLLSGGNRSDGFTVTGQTEKSTPPIRSADLYMVTPGYFDALGTPRLAGRDFNNEVASGPKTAVVNKAFADRLFGGANPVGQHVSGRQLDVRDYRRGGQREIADAGRKHAAYLLSLARSEHRGRSVG